MKNFNFNYGSVPVAGGWFPYKKLSFQNQLLYCSGTRTRNTSGSLFHFSFFEDKIFYMKLEVVQKLSIYFRTKCHDVLYSVRHL